MERMEEWKAALLPDSIGKIWNSRGMVKYYVVQ